MKNKFWVFGDSFSSCNCQGEDSDFMKIIKEIDEDFKYVWWFDVVASILNLDVIYCGVGGNSSPQIIFETTKHLPEIKEGDYVSIGLSDSSRNYMAQRTSHELGITTAPIEPGRIISMGPFCHFHPTPGNEYNYTKRQLKVWDEFMVDFRYHNRDDLQNYYKNIADSLKKHLNNLNVKTVVWGTEMWNEHENYQEYTNNKIQDGHWSPNGNISFARFVINEFKSN